MVKLSALYNYWSFFQSKFIVQKVRDRIVNLGIKIEFYMPKKPNNSGEIIWWNIYIKNASILWSQMNLDTAVF